MLIQTRLPAGFLFAERYLNFSLAVIMTVSYAKYQALGNSFIVLDRIVGRSKSEKYKRLARKICDPIYGVGSDGLMVISRQGNTMKADVYNADGSWAEKSGNGTRIAAMHLYNNGTIKGPTARLETGSGSSRIGFHSGNKQRRLISASLGRPIFEAAEIPVTSRYRNFIDQPIRIRGKAYRLSAVAIGNPHLILFCKDFFFDWHTLGHELESHKKFPNRINVGFVVARNKKNIEVRDWERGVGPTQSSGTGAAAAVAISVMRGFTERRVQVKTLAGTLQVSWDKKSDEILIKGPVEFICSGTYYYK